MVQTDVKIRKFSDPEYHRRGVENLRDVAEMLDKEGVEWCLICGTLLGAVRKADFIPHDYDIDIAIKGNWTYDVISGLARIGFRMIRKYGGARILEYKLSRQGIPLDLFFLYPRDPDETWMAVTNRGRTRRYVFPRISWISVIDFKGIRRLLYMPDNAVEVLRAHYGEDWKTPRSAWSWWSSPKCLEK